MRGHHDERRERTYGLSAGLAVLATRPDAVRRIALHADLLPRLGEHLRAAAARRVQYLEKSDDELRAIAGSEHHEGLVVEALAREVLDDEGVLARFAIDRGPLRLVALDGVENPHNVGAIVRTAAFLGAHGVLVSSRIEAPFGPAAVRVAEGGAEHVALARVRELAAVARALRDEGVAVVGTDAAAPTDARSFAFPRRALVVLGSEASGTSVAVRRVLSHTVGIRGTGAVESLNVSVAAGIVLGAAMRP
jgi:TrmH RNA methyltransferase